MRLCTYQIGTLKYAHDIFKKYEKKTGRYVFFYESILCSYPKYIYLYAKYVIFISYVPNTYYIGIYTYLYMQNGLFPMPSPLNK